MTLYRCDCCDSLKDKMLTCSRCYLNTYCDAHCQKEAWHGSHKQLCFKHPPHLPRPQVRTIEGTLMALPFEPEMDEFDQRIIAMAYAEDLVTGYLYMTRGWMIVNGVALPLECTIGDFDYPDGDDEVEIDGAAKIGKWVFAVERNRQGQHSVGAFLGEHHFALSSLYSEGTSSWSQILFGWLLSNVLPLYCKERVESALTNGTGQASLDIQWINNDVMIYKL